MVGGFGVGSSEGGWILSKSGEVGSSERQVGDKSGRGSVAFGELIGASCKAKHGARAPWLPLALQRHSVELTVAAAPMR